MAVQPCSVARMNLRERIEARLDVSAGPFACHPWLGARIRAYGSVTVDGKSRYVHRVLYCLAHELPYNFDGVVRHVICHNPICGNILHLDHGTRLQNQADMVADGRSTRGERHPMVKLTTADVLVIRESKASRVDIGAEYGITREQVRRIQKRESWAWL